MLPQSTSKPEPTLSVKPFGPAEARQKIDELISYLNGFVADEIRDPEKAKKCKGYNPFFFVNKYDILKLKAMLDLKDPRFVESAVERIKVLPVEPDVSVSAMTVTNEVDTSQYEHLLLKPASKAEMDKASLRNQGQSAAMLNRVEPGIDK